MDAGEFQGTHFLVMEYVEGRDLSVMVKERGPRSVVEACEMILLAALGLAHAHQHGMVHRDIKPGNLFAIKQSVIKILDLGLALSLEDCPQDAGSDGQALTVMGQFLGTPDYMAPEQWEDSHTADGRADLYSLGCTLFFLLTGRAPYADDEHPSMASKMRGHTSEPIPDLRAARREAIANRPKLVNDPLPDEVESLYRRLMAKLPAERVATADELAKTLQEIVKSLRSSPVAPRQESPSAAELFRAQDSERRVGPAAHRRAGPPENNVIENGGPALEASLSHPTAAPNEIPTIIDSPDGSTETDQPVFPTDLSEPTWPATPPMRRAKKSGKSASARERSRSIKTIGLCLGGLVAVVLCGVILFKITRKDGNVTEVSAPDDAQKAEITETTERSGSRKTSDNRKSTSKISTEPRSLTTSATSSATDTAADLGPIDFAAERKAAEWALSVGAISIELKDANGNDVAVVDGKLPAEPFFVAGVNLSDNPRVTDAGLANLRGCRRLIGVGASGNANLTDVGLAHLDAIPSLFFLDLTYCANLTGASIRNLTHLRNLQSLKIPTVADAEIHWFGSWPKLRMLQISSITDRGLEKLATLQPDLEYLHLSGNTKCTLQPLSNFRRLIYLEINEYHLTTEVAQVLAELPALRTISTWGQVPGTFGRLSAVKQLREYYVHYGSDGEYVVTDADFAHLTELSGLEVLSLGGVVPSDAALQQLATMPSLRTLTIGVKPEFRKYTLDRFAKFRELRPDVNLTVDDTNYPPTKLASEVEIPKRTVAPPTIPVEPDKPAPATKKTEIAKANKPVPLAVKVPRVEIPALPLPTKPNKAISNRAIVSVPAPITGLRSWSIEVGGHTGVINGLAYSPDGQSIATVGLHDDTVRLWKITEVANAPVLILDRVFLGEEGGIYDVAWSPDGFTLATTSQVGHSVTLFDVATGRLLKRLALTNGSGRSVAWSPDGRLIAAAHPHRLGLIDPIRGLVRYSQSSAPLVDGCWSPDGSQIATVDGNGGIKFWKPQSLEPTAEFDSAERDLATVAWSPDGKWIATGGVQGVIKIWEAATKKRLHELRPELGTILGLGWEPASAGTSPAKHAAWPRLACVGTNGKLVVWDAAKGDKLLDTPVGESRNVAWSPDGTQIAVAPFNVLALHDSTTGTLIASPANFGRPALYLAYGNLSASGKELRIQQYMDLSVWDADAGSFVKRVENMPNGQSLVSPTDEWLAVFDPNSPQGNLHLVDTATYQNHRALLGHASNITAVNWSNDGKTLASSSKDQTVRLWNAESGEQLQSIPHPNAVRSVVWSPDGKRLATCGNDDIIRLWLVPTGKAAGEFPRLPFACVSSPSGLAWSPDDKYLAIACYDGATHVLDLKSGKLSDPILQFGTGAASVAWSGDSKQLLAGTGGEVGYRTLTAREGVTSSGYGWPVQWLPDRRRFLTGLSGYFPVQGLDAKRNAKIGTLYPHIVGGHHVCISADGHYRGSDGIEQHLVYVALTKDGHQQTYSPADFAAKFNWKNDPTKAVLLGR
jgi:WD40 repeat protein/serine/threonine protein kinase